MRRRRIVAIALGAVLALVLLTFVLGNLREAKATTFRVTVPAATPEEDSIVLHVEAERHVMNAIGNHTYEFRFDTKSLEYNEPRRYGYSRGGFPPFAEMEFLENVGPRTFNARTEPARNDVVAAWKWLPNTSGADPDIGSAAATAIVQARPEFWAGPDLVDFWMDDFPLQFDATAHHAKELGYGWIQLDPPWDYRSTDPPRIANTGVKVPAWPNASLQREVRSFKDAGFHVFLSPQVCCEPISFQDRSEAWWRAWFDQMDSFVRFHAELARDEHVEALSFIAPPASIPGGPGAPSFSAERWDRLWTTARTCGCKVGLSVYTSPQGDVPDNPPFPQESVVFYDRVDFLSVALWDGLVEKDDPTQAEVDHAFDRIFAGIDYANTRSHKPIVFGQVAYASERGGARAKGPEEFPTWQSPASNASRYDAKVQAMAYEAIFRHVASRPYVQGLFPFGYWYVDAPLTLDMSIRDKPAERVYGAWLERLAT